MVVLPPLSIGFTGTRTGMSPIQKDIVFKILSKHNGFFHHGDCIGADAEAHDFVHMLGSFVIHVHPPANPVNRAYKQGHVMHPVKDYYARNADIVNQCQYLIACPKDESKKGGTWWTINFARRRDVLRKFTIIMPNGDIGHDTHKPIPGESVVRYVQ